MAEHVANGEEVIQRFGHLLFVDHHHAGVHPVIDVRAVVGAARLCDLVLVVREHQIGTAAVDVEVGAQLFAVHGGAFDVPARTARPHGDCQLGSPGLDIFHSTKSIGLRFTSSISTRAPACS